jgi:hypothetical protein
MRQAITDPDGNEVRSCVADQRNPAAPDQRKPSPQASNPAKSVLTIFSCPQHELLEWFITLSADRPHHTRLPSLRAVPYEAFLLFGALRSSIFGLINGTFIRNNLINRTFIRPE